MDMRLTEKRRALAEIRRRWRESTPDCPLFLSSFITDTPQAMSISNFCLAFEYLHHMKRHEKSLRVEDESKGGNDASNELTAVTPVHSDTWFVASSSKRNEADPTQLWAEPTLFPPHFHTAGKRTRPKRT